jgi:RecB family exonuclease
MTRGSGPREGRGGGSAARLVASARHLDRHAGAAAGTGRAFRDFVDDAAARLAPDVTLAGSATTRLLAREALARLRSPDLRFPEEPAARVALAHAVDRAIGRLRRAGTAPAHLRETGLGHAALLGDLLEHVDAQLDRAGLADARSAAGIVAARLAGAPAAGEIPEVAAGAVVVGGIAAFEPDDLAVIEALHARLRAGGGAGVRLELPRLAGPIARAPDDAVSPVADVLERRWASLEDPPEIDWIDARPAQPTRVIAARNVDGEARAVAAAVIDALARGAPPERVAVVVPDLDETRLEPFRAALGDAKVPFTEPRGRPVASCPEGRIALTLLAVAAGPVTREEVIELLRAPGLHPGVWMDRASPREAVARAVALAHRLREVPVEIDRTGRLLVDGLASLVRGRRGASPIRAADAGAAPPPDEIWMPRALERALKETRWLGADAGAAPPSRREVARRLLALLDRLEIGRPPRMDLAAALHAEGRGAGPLPLRALGEGAAAVRAIREAVRSIVDGAAAAGLADRPSSVADFAAELGVAVGELGIGLGAASSAAGAAAVRIGRPADLAGLDHDLVLVTGLDEGAYSGAEGDLALLDERVRKRLPAPCRPPSAGEREAWRRAELAWAMASADHVILSYSLGDEGDLAQPHRLVRWAFEHSAQDHREPASRVARRASRIDPRSAELGALAAGAAPRPDVAERVAVERARMAFFLDPRAPGGPYDGRVLPSPEGDPLRGRLVAAVGGDVAARPVAVTAVERAAGCAFAGFARRVLRLRRVDDLGESADARERGTLVHRALHAAFEGVRDAGGALGREVAVEAARAAAERALGLSGSMAALRREALMQAVGDALGVVERAIDEGPGLRFLVAEQGFGAGQAAPWEALAIGGDDEGGALVWIDGQIDRVDVSADGKVARVVDYKTGRLPAADDHGRSAFQLPLYAAVVARALACETVEAAYVSVRPRGVVEEQPRAAEERRALGARRDEIAAAARRVILSMWKGEVTPRPAKAGLCVRCDARDVCRRPAVAPIEEAEERS